MAFTAGQILTAAQLNAIVGLGTVKRVTATGTVTTTDIPSGQLIIILGWSGGGGSGGVANTTATTNAAAAGGGGSGAFGLAVVPRASVTFPFLCTIGAGGAAGAATPAAGGNGGLTSVIDNNGSGSTYLNLAGGTGGALSAVSTIAALTALGGAGGLVTAAPLFVPGEAGGNGWTISATQGTGGTGAAAPWGGGAGPTAISNTTTPRAPAVGNIPGGGASGGVNAGTSAAATGAAGARGEVWFIVL